MGEMRETRVPITGSCAVVLTEWLSFQPSVCLEYVEHSPDPFYSNNETSVDIDAPTAGMIVNVLLRAFPHLREQIPTPPEDHDRDR